jgi:Serine/threonine protein kinase|nr:serine/threonine-protein kinase [uncultured Bacteroides sp.]
MIKTGDVIDGFKISEIKNGGMANVYKGMDKVGFKKAFKAVRPDKAADNPEICRYFLEEIKIMQGLNHPNIVKIDRVIIYQDQTLLEMECLNGLDFKEYIKHKASKGITDKNELKKIALRVLRALAYAHSCNYLHNDIKPSNIFRTLDGYIKLLDFGIAKVVGAHAEIIKGAEQVTLTTQTGDTSFKGSLAYASPEQQAGKELGITSDIFSFGKTLHFIATGSEDMDDDVSDELFAEVVRKCTQQKRSDRFQTCKEVIDYINNPQVHTFKTCPNCDFKVNAETKFCPNCGTAIEVPRETKKCIKCNSDIELEIKNCPNCGAVQTEGMVCCNPNCSKNGIARYKNSDYYGKYCTKCGKPMSEIE